MPSAPSLRLKSTLPPITVWTCRRNKAISRRGNISFTAIDGRDDELIKRMRQLAAYAGICNVRSRDGSNYHANVAVNETYNYASGVKRYDYTLSITGVDPEQLDGITYEESE